jgi:hypothetical protein
MPLWGTLRCGTLRPVVTLVQGQAGSIFTASAAACPQQSQLTPSRLTHYHLSPWEGG